MLRRHKSIKLYIIAFTVVIIIIIVSVFQLPYTRCAFIHSSDFLVLENNVYGSPELDNSTCDSLKMLVNKAIERNKAFWLIEPREFTIIFCVTKSELERYTGRKDAQTISHITPIGTYIVLGTQGYNLDIISHEMSHAVLLQIVGYQNLEHKIPTWFNEGIALQVDYREYMMDSQVEKSYKTNPEYLSNISDFTSFHSSSWDETLKHYLTSRYELRQWLDLNYNELKNF
ncbi:hypothetical protein [uncultured Draconibacterium sp.]|uniref:hypothetical protein n=1 Tax=uncultured Draconibacterium sp. TaxID=1573823 RepID=UPI002AA5EB4D|nr:hypothetical protein [uncultured Draconibacterium sp.]